MNIETGFSSAKWKGMKSAEDFQLISASLETMYKEVSEELPKHFTNNKVDYRSPKFLPLNDSLVKAKAKPIFEHFIKANPEAYVSAYALGTTGISILLTKDLERFYRMLSKDAQNSYYGKNISSHLEGLKNSVVGKDVIPFTLPTPDGKTIEFDSLKGKYILIDFWASWCGPCIASFPHMKEIYEKYKALNFNILSISVDKNKDAWLAEAKKQQMPWLQVLDTENVSKKGFAVSAVPTMYLIDPSGKIVMKEIDFEENGPIERKLKELFEARTSAPVNKDDK
jgi:thiol-disulfide isomerase/thioredoxin